MLVTELDSFVQKFHQLWNAGLNAHLELDAHAGNAWVSLHLQLGHAPGPLHPRPAPTLVPGGARIRRREKRAAARKQAEEAKKAAEQNEKTSEIAEKAKDMSKTENREDSTVNVINEETTEKVEAKAVQVQDAIIDDKEYTSKVNDTEFDDPHYCRICKNSDEIESAEDLSFHMLNDHEPEKVLEIYGQDWIEERKYCIRRGSPFEKFQGFHPLHF